MKTIACFQLSTGSVQLAACFVLAYLASCTPKYGQQSSALLCLPLQNPLSFLLLARYCTRVGQSEATGFLIARLQLRQVTPDQSTMGGVGSCSRRRYSSLHFHSTRNTRISHGSDSRQCHSTHYLAYFLASATVSYLLRYSVWSVCVALRVRIFPLGKCQVLL